MGPRRFVVFGLLLGLGACQFDASGTPGTLAEPGPDAASPLPDAAPAPAKAARVGTANLRCMIDDWGVRVHAIAAELAAIDAEVVALQEVCREPGGRDGLAELLDELELLTGVRYDAVRADTHWAWDRYDEGIAVITRVPVMTSEVVDLPRGTFARKAIVVRVASSAGPLVFAGTHLSFGSEHATTRRQQLAVARDAVAALRQPGDAAAIAGDFNETPGAPAVGAAVAAGYRDAWVEANPGDPGPTVPSPAPEARIDYVLVDGMRAVAAGQFMAQPWGGIWPSDHRGVWAEIALLSPRW